MFVWARVVETIIRLFVNLPSLSVMNQGGLPKTSKPYRIDSIKLQYLFYKKVITVGFTSRPSCYEYMQNLCFVYNLEGCSWSILLLMQLFNISAFSSMFVLLYSWGNGFVKKKKQNYSPCFLVHINIICLIFPMFLRFICMLYIRPKLIKCATTPVHSIKLCRPSVSYRFRTRTCLS